MAINITVESRYLEPSREKKTFEIADSKMTEKIYLVANNLSSRCGEYELTEFEIARF